MEAASGLTGDPPSLGDTLSLDLAPWALGLLSDTYSQIPPVDQYVFFGQAGP